MRQTKRRSVLLAATACYAILSGGCGAPIVPFILNVAVQAGIAFCATKGGEFLDKEFDKLMDNFMDKVGSPKHDKADSKTADNRHPALLIDSHDPNKAVALGFTEIHYGGTHGGQSLTAHLDKADFIKKDGKWILLPEERDIALKSLGQGVQ